MSLPGWNKSDPDTLLKPPWYRICSESMSHFRTPSMLNPLCVFWECTWARISVALASFGVRVPACGPGAVPWDTELDVGTTRSWAHATIFIFRKLWWNLCLVHGVAVPEPLGRAWAVIGAVQLGPGAPGVHCVVGGVFWGSFKGWFLIFPKILKQLNCPSSRLRNSHLIELPKCVLCLATEKTHNREYE